MSIIFLIIAVVLVLYVPHILWAWRLRQRNQDLEKLANEFGLKFEGKISNKFTPYIIKTKDTQVNEITGQYKNHNVKIYDLYNTNIFSLNNEGRRTYILLDGQDMSEKVRMSDQNLFLVPVQEIRKFLQNI